jgi:hypothetical protein
MQYSEEAACKTTYRIFSTQVSICLIAALLWCISAFLASPSFFLGDDENQI